MKKIILIIFLPAWAIYIGGCSKALSTLPDNRAVITTPDQVTQLLTQLQGRTAAYHQLVIGTVGHKIIQCNIEVLYVTTGKRTAARRRRARPGGR